MKRIISVFLCMMIIFTIPFVSINSFATVSEESEYIVDTAVKIGLIPKSFATDANRGVTRGEAFQAVLKLCGVADGKYSEEVKPEFSDLDSNDTYYSSVLAAYSLGIVNGYTDGTIRTQELITVKDTVKILLYALGYKPLIEAGMKLNDAVRKADFCSYADAASSSVLTVEKLARLILDAGESYIVDSANISEFNGELENDYQLSSKTPLSKFFDIYSVEGIVTSIFGADLTMTSPVSSENIRIDDKVYQKKDLDVDEMIGCRVKAYYSSNDNLLRAIYPVKNDIILIDANDVDEFSDGKLFYEKNGKNMKCEINLSAIDFIFNGELMHIAEPEDFKIENGTLKLIDNNSDGKIDVINLVEYKVIVVDSVSRSANVILAKFGKGAVCPDDYKEFEFVSDKGETMEIAEISEWDVLSVIENKSKTTIKLLYSTNEIEGVISDICYEDGIMYITIEGNQYKVSADCKTNQHTLLKIGAEGVFCMDSSNNICAIKVNGQRNIGWLMRIRKKSGISSVVNAKILTDKNEIKIFDVADKIDYNGDKIKEALAENIPENVLVSYSVNKDGEINCIDTPCDENGAGLGIKESLIGSLQMYYNGYENDGSYTEKEVLQYKASSGIIGGKVCVNSDTPIFIIPVGEGSGDESKYDSYSCGSYLAPDDKICIQAYKTQPESFSSSAIVIYKASGSDSLLSVPEDSTIYVVDKVRVAINELGEETYVIGAQSDGKYTEFKIIDDVILKNIKFNGSSYTIGSGDIIKLVANTYNEIQSVEVHYSYRTNKMKDNINPNTSDYLSLFHLQLAYAYKKSGAFCQTTTTPLDSGVTVTDESQLEYLEMHNLSKYTILRYNSSEKKIERIGQEDICDYYRAGANCSRMIIYDRFGDPRIIVVYD